MPPTPRLPVNRRDFLRAATAAAVAPMIVPRHVVAGSQATPPSDRITIGHIGVGRMGGGHVRGFLKMPDVRVAAICDIREETLDRMTGAVNQHYGDKACLGFTDFRELLARKDIDAVVIAPGERWHPLVGIEAARRGKHMYCEKPLTLTCGIPQMAGKGSAMPGIPPNSPTTSRTLALKFWFLLIQRT